MTIREATPFAIAALVSLAASGAVTTSARAQDVAESTGPVLEEVVVTTRRREENLQDVPAAVSAFSADQLRELAITNLEDINSLAPNIKVNPGRATSNTINAYIRGVGQNDPLWGFEPGVGIYIDDVYIARPQGALLDVYDVQRIEILRGPQGTLYGKNTLAGAIKYVTRDIVGEPAFDATLAAGSYGQIDMKLAGSRAIGEHVYIGASLAKLTRNGFGEVVPDVNPYQFNHVGEDVSDKNILAGRAEVNFLWGASSRLRIMGDFVKDTSNVRGGQRLNDVFGPRLKSRYDVRNDMPVNEENFENKGVSQRQPVQRPGEILGSPGKRRAAGELHGQPHQGRRRCLLFRRHGGRFLRCGTRHLPALRRPDRPHAGIRWHRELRRLLRRHVRADGSLGSQFRGPLQRGQEERARVRRAVRRADTLEWQRVRSDTPAAGRIPPRRTAEQLPE
jgi:outer membrane receptor protein involved in Fe transport